MMMDLTILFKRLITVVPLILRRLTFTGVLPMASLSLIAHRWQPTLHMIVPWKT